MLDLEEGRPLEVGLAPVHGLYRYTIGGSCPLEE
jgi:hypothetical protein